MNKAERQWASSSAYPVFPELLPSRRIDDRRYEVRFARDEDDLERIQRLRFEVFNLELGEGLAESFDTGLDRDRFDAVCHHLMVFDRASEEVIGTYRMQTTAMARAYGGFYSEEEFDLGPLPDDVVEDAVEIGRACVAREYRNRHVLFLLWRGLAAYLQCNRKRYLFGCCSLTSQDPAEGKRVMDHLVQSGQVHPTLRLRPQPDWECYPDGFRVKDETPRAVDLPRLFKLYLRYGARVCGEPAIDRFFRTIDYLVLLDLDDLDEHTRGMFFR